MKPNQIKMLFFISSLLFLMACKEDKKASIIYNGIPIDSKIESNSNIFDIIDNLEIIEIQHRDSLSFTLNKINKAIWHEDKLFLSTDSDEIHLVNSDLTIIKTLYDKGMGPNEYREIKDFDIHPKTKEIFVYDFQKQRFLVYDGALNYKSTKNLGFNVTAFKFLKQDMILFTAKHRNMIDGSFMDFDLLLVDSDFNIKEKAIPFNNDKFQSLRLHKKNPFHWNGKEVIFNDMISDTVYSITENKISSSSHYSYLNNKIPEEIKKLGHEEMLKKFKKSSQEYQNIDLLANLHYIDNKHVVSSFSHNEKSVFSIFSIANRNFKNFEFPENYNNHDYQNILKPYKGPENLTLISFVYPYVLDFIKSQYLRNHDEDSFTKRIDEILKENIEDGNQIFLKYKIKDF